MVKGRRLELLVIRSAFCHRIYQWYPSIPEGNLSHSIFQKKRINDLHLSIFSYICSAFFALL